MNEELKKALELLKTRADLYATMSQLEKIEDKELAENAQALVLIEKALDKPLEIVKKNVESARFTLANVDDDIEERQYYTGRKEMAEQVLYEIITEAEGKTK